MAFKATEGGGSRPERQQKRFFSLGKGYPGEILTMHDFPGFAAFSDFRTQGQFSDFNLMSNCKVTSRSIQVEGKEHDLWNTKDLSFGPAGVNVGTTVNLSEPQSLSVKQRWPFLPHTIVGKAGHGSALQPVQYRSYFLSHTQISFAPLWGL